MGGNGKNSRETRRRLVESACRLFAEKGYHNASISDICLHANANVAAVNYHFGDKKGLFQQVWRHGYDVATREYPICNSKEDMGRPEAYVRSFVSAMVGRIFDRGAAGCFSRIMFRAMANPAGNLEECHDEVFLSESRALREVVYYFLGNKGKKMLADICLLGILGPCLLLMLQGSPGRELFVDRNPDIKELEAMVDCFTRFVLAGMHAIKVFEKNGEE